MTEEQTRTHTIEPHYMDTEWVAERHLDYYNSNEPVFMGYSLPELRAAFNAVKNPDDWKAPIVDAKVAQCNLDLTINAIAFFTGEGCMVLPGVEGFVNVNSRGYRGEESRL